MLRQEVDLFLLTPTDGNLLQRIEDRFTPIANKLPPPLSNAILSIIEGCKTVYSLALDIQKIEQKIKEDPSNKNIYEPFLKECEEGINSAKSVLNLDLNYLPMG